MNNKFWFLLIGLFIFLIAPKITSAQFSPTSSPPVTEIYELAINFKADYGSLSRFYFIDNAPERRERFDAFYKDYLSRLDRMDFEKLSTGGK